MTNMDAVDHVRRHGPPRDQFFTALVPKRIASSGPKRYIAVGGLIDDKNYCNLVPLGEPLGNQSTTGCGVLFCNFVQLGVVDGLPPPSPPDGCQPQSTGPNAAHGEWKLRKVFDSKPPLLVVFTPQNPPTVHPDLSCSLWPSHWPHFRLFWASFLPCLFGSEI